MNTNSVKHVRDEFAYLLHAGRFTAVNREASMTSIVGSKTIEIVGAAFIADQDALFGEVNWDYVMREEEWYNLQSRNVNDFPGGAPAVWKAIAASDGTVCSNYGWCVYGVENGYQFHRVVAELKKNPESRRAIAIYTRPSMWVEYNQDGRSDFMCTNTVQYLVRDGVVHAVVNMRSNDAHIGYKNDCAWQRYVLADVAKALGSETGNLYWQVGSLHVYERDFYLVDHFGKTGEASIKKAAYRELYPASPYGL